jgi:DNA-binding MarR family transcriptional regulator
LDGDADLRLERFLPYRLSVLANRVSQAVAWRYEAQFGLTIPEWRAMAVLAREPGATATDLVARTAMDKVAVSRAISRLVAAARVSAEADKDDSRRQRLALTEAGAAVYREIAPMALEIEARLLGALSPAEAAALDALIGKLDDAARTL